MARVGISLALLVSLTGCSKAVISGTLTDGLTNQPVAEQRLVIKADSDSASLTCQAFETTTDASGAFTFGDACTGTGYTLSVGDDTWWIPEGTQIADGGAEGLALSAWRNGPGEGLYHLSGGDFNAIRTTADVRTTKIYKSEEDVRMPWDTIPARLTRIAPGEYLVINGPRTVEKMEIHPAIKSEARRFGNTSEWEDMGAWTYIGVRFEDDTTFERVAAKLDDSKVITKAGGDRAGKYIPAEALEAGRYALLEPEGRVVTLLDVGPAPAEE